MNMKEAERKQKTRKADGSNGRRENVSKCLKTDEKVLECERIHRRGKMYCNGFF